ncbi:LuxR family transcriptional regulator [Saccharopolyspora taberi]|uniref:LuxR family transcriptional regulator n=2 Tax=Saccharopolyspora taberi TaxID=60895 RepID=A0ABN3V4C9_9PSEU
MAELQAALEGVRAGTGGCIILEGEPGIGKSTMIDVALDQARAAGVSVASGKATELDRLLPLAGLQKLLAEIPGAESVLRSSVPESNPLLLVRALESCVEEWASGGPVVLSLEDVHWADEMTLLVLRNLVPISTHQCPVLFLFSKRPTDTHSYVSRSLAQLLRDGARLQRVGPLDDADTLRMCTELLGTEPGPEIVRMARECAGNPFLLEELLTTLRKDGHVRMVDGKATVVAGDLPSGFADAVEQHLRCVCGQTRWLLSIASVLGRPFTVQELSMLSGIDVSELIPRVVEAIETSILVEEGPALAFRHDLLRQALYKRLQGPVRSGLHRQAATVLKEAGCSPVETTEHLIRSGQVSSDEAVRTLREAVEQVAPMSPNTAADMILRMLDVLGDDESPASLVAEAVRLLATAGRIADATEIAERRLLHQLNDEEEAALLLGLSEALYVTGRNGSVLEYTARALRKPNLSESQRADLMAIRSWALISSDDLDAAEQHAIGAVEHSTRGGSGAARACGTAAQGVVERLRGRIDRGMRLGLEAVSIADTLRGEALHRHARLWVCRTMVAADRFGEAASFCDRGIREANRMGTRWSQPYYQLCRAELSRASGRLAESHHRALKGLELAEQANVVAPMVHLLALLGELALHEGRMGDAAAHLNRADQLVATEECDHVDVLAWSLAQLFEARDRPDVALETVERIWAELPKRRGLLLHDPGFAVWSVRLGMRLGKHRKARAVMRTAREVADLNPQSSSLLGAALQAEGLLRGDPSLLRQAVQRLRASPRPLLRAEALEDLGRVETGSSRVALLEEARDLYRSSGAARLEARAESALPGRSAGVADEPLREHTSAEWQRLTRSETRVVRLVVEGLTNRAIALKLNLSPHTVDSHLRHSFAKLSVASRVELTRKLLKGGSGQHT